MQAGCEWASRQADSHACFHARRRKQAPRGEDSSPPAPPPTHARHAGPFGKMLDQATHGHLQATQWFACSSGDGGAPEWV